MILGNWFESFLWRWDGFKKVGEVFWAVIVSLVYAFLALFLVWKEEVGALSSSITSPSFHLFEDATIQIQIQVRWFLLGASEPPMTKKHGNLNLRGLNTLGDGEVVTSEKGERTPSLSRIERERV